MRRVGAGILATFLLVWFSNLTTLGGRVWRGEEELPIEGVDAQMDWSKCSLELSGIQFTRPFVDEESVEPSSEPYHQMSLLLENKIEKYIALLPPDMKYAVTDCLSKQHFPFLVSGEEESPRKWYLEYIELIFEWFTGPRRQLAEKISRSSPPASAPTPTTALASVLGPSPVVDSPVYPPVLPPTFAPVSSPVPSYPVLLDSLEQASSSRPNFVKHGPSHDTAQPLPSRNDENSTKKMVTVVVLTATGSIFFTSLLFCCYNFYFERRVIRGYGQRDVRPLLALTSSNISPGSSEKTFTLKSSISSDEQVISSNDKSTDTPLQTALPQASNFSSEISVTPVIPLGQVVPKPPHPPVMPPKEKLTPPRPPLPPPHLKTTPQVPPLPKGSPASITPLTKGKSKLQSPFLRSSHKGDTYCQETVDSASKTKLKPLFWDKVLATPDQAMVWDQIRSGSFQFNEEMIESLFGYSPENQKNIDKKKSVASDTSQYVKILDPKKSQNVAILLRALNVTTDEVRDALVEGNELRTELLQTLIKMAPTPDEELKLRLYAGEISHLGPAERFLKSLIDIPLAFKRLEALLFMGSFEEDISSIKKDLATIEAACIELKGSRLFKKLLEAVVKIGNRMNDGTYRGDAQAFKLDTLLKLADVKGTGGKTTLLNFVVHEIIRSEGMRAEREAKASISMSGSKNISNIKSYCFSDCSPNDSQDYYCRLGLQVVSGLTNELEHVKNAAFLDVNAMISTIEGLGGGLLRMKEFLNKDLRRMEVETGFLHFLERFVEHADADTTLLFEEEKRVKFLVKSTTDFFHGHAGKDEGLGLFVIVRDFLKMLDKACKEIGQVSRQVPKISANKEVSNPSSSTPRQLLFPSAKKHQMHSSDDESS